MVLTLRLASRWQKAASDKEQPGSLKRRSAVERWCRRGTSPFYTHSLLFRSGNQLAFSSHLSCELQSNAVGVGDGGWEMGVGVAPGFGALCLPCSLLS